MFCPNCGNKVSDLSKYCPYCNTEIRTDEMLRENRIRELNRRSPLTAGILIILGGFIGIHNFYLGQTKLGLAKLLLGTSVIVMEDIHFSSRLPSMFITCATIIILLLNLKEFFSLYHHKVKTKYELRYTPKNWKLLGITGLVYIILIICTFIIYAPANNPSMDYIRATTAEI